MRRVRFRTRTSWQRATHAMLCDWGSMVRGGQGRLLDEYGWCGRSTTAALGDGGGHSTRQGLTRPELALARLTQVQRDALRVGGFVEEMTLTSRIVIGLWYVEQRDAADIGLRIGLSARSVYRRREACLDAITRALTSR